MPEAATNPEQEAGANVQIRLQAGLAPNVPRIYFNSSVQTLTLTDICCVLEQNGAPVCVLNMSYTTAKTFAAKIGQLVATLEGHAKREIMTGQDIEEFLKAGPESK